MSYRERMQLWVREAIAAEGGTATILQVAKHIWREHETELKSFGDQFYSWQYDMRWAAQQLRDTRKLEVHKQGTRSLWVLKP